ncbi:MAG: AarF/ABC1/UbiB kinase family protein [Candidatus Woesearchaeota archaeon]
MNHTIARAGQVVNVLFRNGLSYFVHELGLKWHLPFFKKIAPKGKSPPDLPARLRKTMEELGGAYLKFGQYLSLRPDLLPKEYCNEFKKLLDKVPPMPYTKVQHVIETNLKAPIKTFFSHFDTHPIGSASIAQVHKAKLKNGKNVVVKVQRPEAKAQFSADIQIMYYFARKIEKRFPDAAINPVTLVREFERYTAQEFNFVYEARTIDRFYQHFKGTKVVIPQVRWGSTTSQVLTMDFLDGIPLTEFAKTATKAQSKTLAKTIANASFEQVFELGLFHADMHPGNILVLPGNRIGLLDFGIVGTLNDELLRTTAKLYAALVDKDITAITEILLKSGIPSPDTNLEDLKVDIEQIINAWYGTELGQARVTQMMQALFESAVQHKITMPSGFVLFGKALATVEGTCLSLDPEFNFVEFSQPKIMRLLKEHKKPKALLKSFTNLSKKYGELLAGLPKQTTEALERLKKGSIDLNIRETDIKHLGMDLNRSSNRLAYAMIIAALLISAAMLIDVPPKIGNYSAFTIIGLFLATIFLIALVVSVWREGTAPFDPHREGK